MFVIQSGIVKIVTKFDKRRDDEFIIERLTRGAIINAKSFMIRDDVDTTFQCETVVKCLVLTSAKVDSIASKRSQVNQYDLEQAKKRVNKELSIPANDIALDYIVHNNENASVEKFKKKAEDNALKIRLKNAVMQEWSLVMKKRKSKSIKDLVNEMMEAKENKKKDRDKTNED